MGLRKFVGPIIFQEPVTYPYVSQMNPVHAATSRNKQSWCLSTLHSKHVVRSLLLRHVGTFQY